MLSKRQKNIINYISKSSDPITSSKIADDLKISLRTVKRDIKTILDENPGLFIAGRNGYQLNDSIDFDILQEIETPENYEERRRYILKKLLLNEPLTVNGLCDSLYISPSTLQNELSLIRTDLKPLGLNLHIKQDSISISGTDKGRRKLLQEFINEELSSSPFYVQNIQKYLPDADIEWLMSTVNKLLKKNEYFLDNYALTNYVTHLAILCESKETYETSHDFSNPVANNPIYLECRPMMEELQKIMSLHYGKDFSLKSVYDASFLMLTRIARKGYIPDKEGLNLIDETTKDLVNQIINEVWINYSIDLNKEDFIILFSFHIKNLLIRLKNNTPIINVQFKEIKRQFPMLYSIGVFVAKKIENTIGYNISEDEIAFITLHIGTVIEQDQLKLHKLNCVLYAPNYYSLGEKLSRKLEDKFNEDIYIIDVITDGNKIPDDDSIDFVVSTSELNNFHKLPYVVVTPFFTQTDLINCFNLIEKLKIIKQKRSIMKNINLFFKEDCFFLNCKYKNREEVLNAVCSKMHSLKYVDSNFLNKVKEREKISSTAFGYVAIPHPLNNDASNSIISVVIDKNGIQWGESKVYIIFLLSIKREDQKYFREIFDFISLFTEDEKSMKKIIQVESYKDFVDFLEKHN